ncbi:MAG: hypothetical protein FD162_1992 [Rhodobacteraceae bacterium]|nr:MAG: hypothetical protein FD162_1992 [Paracoccaceae bacterium]
MQRRPVFCGILGQKRDQHHRATDHRHQPQMRRALAFGSRQPVNPAILFNRRQRHQRRQQRHAAQHPGRRPARAAQRPGGNRPARVAEGIGGMAQVHQMHPARVFQRRHTGVHQHIGQPGARPARHHRQWKQPQTCGLPRQRKTQTHQRTGRRQGPAAKRHPRHRRHQHRDHRRNRRHEHQRPQPRFINIQHRLDIGQVGCKTAPQHPHRGKGRHGGPGNAKGGDKRHLGLLQTRQI